MPDLNMEPSADLLDLLDRLEKAPDVPSSMKVQAATRIMAMHSRIVELEDALRDIADGYRGADDDRPQAFRFSQIARKALKINR